MAESRRIVDADHYSGNDLGYYSRTSLDDIINNFMVAYVGEDKVISKVNRHEVAFWAQRAVQEFSYDMFHSNKALEIELGPTLSMALPSDYVGLVKVSWLDPLGAERVAYRSRQATPSQAVLQDQDYNYIFDHEGEVIKGDKSEQETRYQNPETRTQLAEIAQNYYYNYITDYNYSYYNESYYGRQWGANPEEINVNGTYILDLVQGRIFFDSFFRPEQFVTLRYVSDGLGDNDDLTEVYVPKLAEDALYARILADLSKLRPSAAGAAALYLKQAKAKMNTAKIRLMELKTEEMAQIMRGKSKWIKH